MAAMTAIALGAMAAGGLMQAKAAHDQGVEAKNNSIVNAAQLKIVANQEKGIAQRKSSEVKRQNRLLQSRIIALNAAGGGDSTEKNVSDLLVDTAAEGQFSSLNALYEGDVRANRMDRKASSVIAGGRSAKRAAKTNMATSILGTASNMGSFASKYSSPPARTSNVNSTSSNLDF